MSKFLEEALRLSGPAANGLSSTGKLQSALAAGGMPAPNPAAAKHMETQAAETKARFEAYTGLGHVDPTDPGKWFKIIDPGLHDGDKAGVIFKNGIGYTDHPAQASWLGKLGCHVVDRRPEKLIKAANAAGEPETWAVPGENDKSKERPPRYKITIPKGRKFSGHTGTLFGLQFENGVADTEVKIAAGHARAMGYEVVDRFPNEP